MNFIKNNIIAFALGMGVIVLTAYNVKDAATPKKTELMMVEIIFGFEANKDVSGIYTTNNAGETQKVVDLIGYVGSANISKNAGKIQQYLKKQFISGWELESSTGGDNSKRYIFRK